MDPELLAVLIMAAHREGCVLRRWTGSSWQRVAPCYYRGGEGRLLGPRERLTVVPLKGDERDPIMVPLTSLALDKGR